MKPAEIAATRIAASALGVYAGLLGAVHGYFEMRQGNVAPGGLMISAIGPPCRPEAVAHACFPALTLVPNFWVTGMLALLVGLFAAVWAGVFIERKRGGLILAAALLLSLLVGGGFVPTFIGLMAGFAGSRIHKSSPWLHTHLPPNAGRLLARLWPWPLVIYFLWVFPVQWLLGRFSGTWLLNAGPLLFLCFDLGLPGLAVLNGWVYDQSLT